MQLQLALYNFPYYFCCYNLISVFMLQCWRSSQTSSVIFESHTIGYGLLFHCAKYIGQISYSCAGTKSQDQQQNGIFKGTAVMVVYEPKTHYRKSDHCMKYCLWNILCKLHLHLPTYCFAQRSNAHICRQVKYVFAFVWNQDVYQHGSFQPFLNTSLFWTSTSLNTLLLLRKFINNKLPMMSTSEYLSFNDILNL